MSFRANNESKVDREVAGTKLKHRNKGGVLLFGSCCSVRRNNRVTLEMDSVMKLIKHETNSVNTEAIVSY